MAKLWRVKRGKVVWRRGVPKLFEAEQWLSCLGVRRGQVIKGEPWLSCKRVPLFYGSPRFKFCPGYPGRGPFDMHLAVTLNDEILDQIVRPQGGVTIKSSVSNPHKP